MKRAIGENAVKNIIVLVLLVLSYHSIQQSLYSSPIANDSAILGSLLVAVSILAVTACFGNFAFTYEKVEHASFGWRLFAHTTTGVLMLLIGLSLEMTSVISNLLIGSFLVFDLSLVLLYVASILYDFWDFKRARL
jgi:hypothetical protein